MRRHETAVVTAAMATVTLLVAACGGGSGDGGGGGGNGAPSPPPQQPPPQQPPPELSATFSSIQQHVFTPICTACHVGEAAPAGLRLSAAEAYALLVDVPSENEPQYLRVEPGNPEDSYLIMALEGRAQAIPRMPDGGEPLPQADIDVIRQWIAEGAQPPSQPPGNGEQPPDPYEEGASVAAATAPIAPATLSAAWPVDGATLRVPPRSLVVAASAELDTTGLHAYSVWLERVDEHDPLTLSAARVAGAALEVTTLWPTTIRLDVSGVDWREGEYALRITGSGAWAVTDRNGRAVDGNGDGSPGGDFTLQFALKPER